LLCTGFCAAVSTFIAATAVLTGCNKYDLFMVIIGSNLIAHTEYMVQSTLQLIVAMIAAISRAVAGCCLLLYCKDV